MTLAAKPLGYPAPRKDVVPGKPHIVFIWGKWRVSLPQGFPFEPRNRLPTDDEDLKFERCAAAERACHHKNLMGFWPSKTPHRLLQGVVRAWD